MGPWGHEVSAQTRVDAGGTTVPPAANMRCSCLLASRAFQVMHGPHGDEWTIVLLPAALQAPCGSNRPVSWYPVSFRESPALKVTHNSLGRGWGREMMLGHTPRTSFLSVQGRFPLLAECWEPEVHRHT